MTLFDRGTLVSMTLSFGGGGTTRLRKERGRQNNQRNPVSKRYPVMHILTALSKKSESNRIPYLLARIDIRMTNAPGCYHHPFSPVPPMVMRHHSGFTGSLSFLPRARSTKQCWPRTEEDTPYQVGLRIPYQVGLTDSHISPRYLKN